jgi:hypothetical protein
MPWCENSACGKTGLKPEEVEFDDDNKRILCKECFKNRVTIIVRGREQPVSGDEWPFSYELHVTSSAGIQAKVGVGDLSIMFGAPISEIKKMFDVR